MTINQELINFMCERFEAVDCETALETCAVALKEDIADKQEYTLTPAALDRMRAAYKKRLDKLKGKS